ncbi:MAG: PAS domain S-box protein [Desulfobacterales bacterium]|jgi:PAS domain S-box-containing protein
MADEPTYEELRKRVKEIEKEVAELKQDKELLKKSEEKFTKAFKFSPTLMTISSIEDGKYIEVSESFVHVTGYTEEESIGTTSVDLGLISQKDRNELKKAIIENGSIEGVELTLRKKNGDTFHCLYFGETVSIAGKENLLSIATDITDRKQAEEMLRKSEKKYQDLYDNAPDMFVSVDAKTATILDCNQTLVDALGYTKAEVIDRPAFDMYTPDSAEYAKANVFPMFVKTGTIRGEELQLQRKDGSAIDVSLNVSAVRDEKGDIIRSRSVWRDITERKRAEEALRESQGKLNAMLQSICDHMSMMDKDLNIIWANKIAKEVFGNDIIGKKCYEVYHQRKVPCEPYPCLTLKAFQDGKIHEHDTQVIDKDGKEIFFHCTANVALRDKEGKPTAVLEISRDTTEHKQAELVLIERGKELENKTQELEEVNAALKVLLKHREEDKKDLEDKVVANVKELVLPYVEKLNNSQLNNRQMVYLNIIKSNLEDIITPFLHQLSSKYSDLTPNEIQVAGFVKEGKRTKEIAELLNSSTGAINFHRNNLRKKLGLRNTKTNLRSFLLSLG